MHRLKTMVSKALPTILHTGQRFGVNIVPNHFYCDIPDINSLSAETYWRKPWSMIGVRGTDLDVQLRALADWCEKYRDRLEHGDIYSRAIERNGEVGYGPIEAEVLYCFVRATRPRRIVQVGAGVATAIILNAVEDEPGYVPQITCIDPYPTRLLRDEHSAARIRLIAEPAQKVDLNVLLSLEADDLLFIDSTHTIRTGSEVLPIVLEVFPRLKSGVFVHFHDITFPYDYEPGILKNAFFFSRETAFLHAFLCGNEKWQIVVSLSMLHHGRTDGLRRLLPDYRPQPMKDGLTEGEGHFPSSTYLRRTEAG